MVTIIVCLILWLALVMAAFAMAEYIHEDPTDSAFQFVLTFFTPVVFLVLVIASIRQFNTNRIAVKVRAQERILREREANKDIAKDFDKFLGEN